MKKLFLGLLWVFNFFGINAQENSETILLNQFLNLKKIDKDSCFTIHSPYAWKGARVFDKMVEATLLQKAIVNDDYVEMEKGKYRAKWLVDSIMLSGSEKYFIDFKMHKQEYIANANGYRYQFSKPVIVRDSVGIMYYEESNTEAGGHCMLIFIKGNRKSAKDDSIGWRLWIKESCSRWIKTAASATKN